MCQHAPGVTRSRSSVPTRRGFVPDPRSAGHGSIGVGRNPTPRCGLAHRRVVGWLAVIRFHAASCTATGCGQVTLDDRWALLRSGDFVVINKDHNIRPLANDPEREHRLWDATAELLGQTTQAASWAVFKK